MKKYKNSEKCYDFIKKNGGLSNRYKVRKSSRTDWWCIMWESFIISHRHSLKAIPNMKRIISAQTCIELCFWFYKTKCSVSVTCEHARFTQTWIFPGTYIFLIASNYWLFVLTPRDATNLTINLKCFFTFFYLFD